MIIKSKDGLPPEICCNCVYRDYNPCIFSDWEIIGIDMSGEPVYVCRKFKHIKKITFQLF